MFSLYERGLKTIHMEPDSVDKIYNAIMFRLCIFFYILFLTNKNIISFCLKIKKNIIKS